MLRLLDRIIDAAVRAAAFLVLPVSLLLFLQWPLRGLAHGYSREANKDDMDFHGSFLDPASGEYEVK